MRYPIGSLAFVLSLLPTVVAAGAITDYLAGIGITAPAAADAPAAWVPDAGFGGAFTVDDSVGVHGYVDPGYGGQPYDLEALYLQRAGDAYLITGISGAPQVGPAGSPPPIGASSNWAGHGTGDWGRQYGLGDFFVGTLAGSVFNPLFAVELDGHTYEIDTRGYTTAQTPAHAAGSVVVGMELRHGLPEWGGVSDPTQIGNTSGTVVGTASMSYEYLNDVHAGFQARLDAELFESLLDGNGLGALHWGEACGNDYVLTRFETMEVAAPRPLPLLVIGVVVLLVLRLRQDGLG